MHLVSENLEKQELAKEVEVAKEVYEDLLDIYTKHADQLSTQQFAELVTKYS